MQQLIPDEVPPSSFNNWVNAAATIPWMPGSRPRRSLRPLLGTFSPAPGTCNSAEDYWAATGQLLGISVVL
ncbi:hypothetical protein [Arthrobacter sp. LAR12-1-1.1]|uniref:hypothetical protein n=1 Tax=Arthrobacter sp. LAR12-1-1.1 TaxID=3135215 RepID=UPI0034216766